MKIKNILLFSLLLSNVSLKANINITIYQESIKDGYEIYADNNEFCEVSVDISFNLVNLKSIQGNNKVFVIPAKSKKVHLTDLKVIRKNVEYKFSYNFKSNYGNHYKNDYNDSISYYLPFKKDESYLVSQGYNGPFSHQGENAIDFDMPEHTEIHAARDGIVIKVVQNNNKHCEQRKCSEYNNFILVYHSDSTFAEYTHIEKNGSMVKEGDKITTGQLIGFSGNVGWSSAPHLHFVVFLPRITDIKSLKTKFLIDDGNKSENLVVKKKYFRGY